VQHKKVSRRILVWGASGGVGAAVTERLCGSGHAVIAYCRKPEELAALKRTYPSLIVRAFTIDEAFYVQEKTYLQKHDYTIAGVVDCVGSVDIAPEATLTDRLDAILRPNLYHQYFSSLTLKDLLEKDSSIVLLSSIRALTGTDNANIEYAFAKAALENLAKSLIHTLKESRTRVNCVRCTPITETKMSGAWPAEVVDTLTGRSIYDELLKPQDVVDVVDFLLGRSSRAITGSIIDASRGFI
jgi:3-oxoacyl-[acyl-carrier protein] reductase